MGKSTHGLVQCLRIAGAICALMTSLCIPGTALAKMNTVYLTFDDGPSERYTPEILHVLKKEHVKATFFLVGYRVKEYPEVVRRITQAGHEIGNHGYHHYKMIYDSKESLAAEIRETDDVIQQVCGVKPTFYRPPRGYITGSQVRFVETLGHPVVLWTIDSRDWMPSSKVDDIVKNVESNARNGAVILMHDGVSNSKRTVLALGKVIRDLKKEGYVFQPLPTGQFVYGRNHVVDFTPKR